MLICNYKKKRSAAALFAATISLAACGRGDSTAHASEIQWDSGQPVPVSVSLPDDTIASDATWPTLVERRHFAIYRTYRGLFDDAPAVFQTQSSAQDAGLQPAQMTTIGANLPACTIRALLMQD